MGGATKKPISNIEKRLKKQQEEAEKKEKKKAPSKTGKEVISRNVVVDDDTRKKVMDELKAEKVVTPYVLAQKAGITISVAKKILEQMASEGAVKLVAKNRRTAVYVAS